MIDLHLVKQLGDFQVNISFSAPQVGVTALFGRSGAGKTSIINMMAGLVRPDEGYITINGRTLFNAAAGIHIAPEKRRIGYIFQDGRLFPHLTVKSNLTYGMQLTPSPERYVCLDDVVDLLGLDHLLSRRPAKLSGGEKQRVAIGRALLMSPELLLMDEPLASLDNSRKAEVLPFLARLCSDVSIPILYVSHCLEEIRNLVDNMVLVHEGRVVASGPIHTLIKPSEVRQLSADLKPGPLVSGIGIEELLVSFC